MLISLGFKFCYAGGLGSLHAMAGETFDRLYLLPVVIFFPDFRRSSEDEPLRAFEAAMLWCKEPVNTKENKCHSAGFTRAVHWLDHMMRRSKYSLSDSPGELSHICHQSSF